MSGPNGGCYRQVWLYHSNIACGVDRCVYWPQICLLFICQWSVLQCRHCYCLECVRIYVCYLSDSGACYSADIVTVWSVYVYLCYLSDSGACYSADIVTVWSVYRYVCYLSDSGACYSADIVTVWRVYVYMFVIYLTVERVTVQTLLLSGVCTYICLLFIWQWSVLQCGHCYCLECVQICLLFIWQWSVLQCGHCYCLGCVRIYVCYLSDSGACYSADIVTVWSVYVYMFVIYLTVERVTVRTLLLSGVCTYICLLFIWQWSVLQCGHCYCLECVRVLVEEYSCGNKNPSLKCPVCRQRTRHADISYVSTKGSDSDKETDGIKVKVRLKVSGCLC